MLTDAVKNWVRTWSARLIRKLQIRGRADTGYYGTDNSGADPSDGDVGMTVQRYQLYGLTSEPPSGTECVVLAVNGGTTNRVAVAELPQNVPAIEADEVLLWARAGQRVLLNKDGDVVVVPAAGRKVLLGSATGTDPVVLKSELNTLLSTVRTWLNSHTHPTPSGASSAPTSLIASLSVSGSPNTEAKS
jgi:hypothetical protein